MPEEATAIAPIVKEVVRRVVAASDPDRILLFGSAARAAPGPHSDLDLLVIKSGPIHRGRLTEQIYLSLLGVDQAVDVIVVTPEDIERYQDAPCLVIAPALRVHRVIYERDAITAG